VKGTLCKKTQLILGAFVAFGPFWHALFPGFRGENGAVAAIVWYLESAKPVAFFSSLVRQLSATKAPPTMFSALAMRPGGIAATSAAARPILQLA